MLSGKFNSQPNLFHNLTRVLNVNENQRGVEQPVFTTTNLLQRWDEREKHLAKFLRDLTGQFRQIRTTDGFATNRNLQVCIMRCHNEFRNQFNKSILFHCRRRRCW